MPVINRLIKAVPALILLSVGWPQVSAQQPPVQAPAPGQGLPNDRLNTTTMPQDPSWLRGKLDKEFEKNGAGPGQQSLKITKGKDYDKLPADFQWATAPTPVAAPFPVYPFELLRTKVAGKVRAYIIIGPTGRVARADLDEAANPEFGLAVRAMLDRCEFKPAKKKDGTPALAYIGLEYDFQPKGHSDVPVTREARFILNDLEKKPESILSPKDLDHPLKPLERAAPVYPLALQKTMPAGEAEVEFFVDTSGYVQLPRLKSSSAPEFGYAAVQAVAGWKFEPPTKGGKAVVVRVVVPMEFEGRAAAPAQK